MIDYFEPRTEGLSMYSNPLDADPKQGAQNLRAAMLALEDMGITDEDRIHVSPYKIESLDSCFRFLVPFPKPVCYDERSQDYVDTGLFWYAFGTGWLRWLRVYSPEWMGCWIYRVSVNQEWLYVIRDLSERKRFEKTYGADGGDFWWDDVAKQYAGIECPTRRGLLEDWGVPSGVAWNTHAVTGLDLIWECA